MADGLEDLLRACTVRVLGGPMPGAGFFVAPGTVVTCAHVIGDSTSLTVRWERDGAAPSGLPVTGPPLILPSRGRAIKNLDRDYPDIAVLTVKAPDGHPCVRMDLTRPEFGDHVMFFGYPEEGGSVHLTPAGLTYRGPHGTSPTSFWDLGADTVKPGMSGAAALHLRSGGVGAIVVASKNPARAEGALAVPWHEVEGDLSAVLAANRAFHEAEHRWSDAARAAGARLAAAGTPAEPQSAIGGAPGTEIHGGQGIQAGSQSVQYNFYGGHALAPSQASATTATTPPALTVMIEATLGDDGTLESRVRVGEAEPRQRRAALPHEVARVWDALRLPGRIAGERMAAAGRRLAGALLDDDGQRELAARLSQLPPGATAEVVLVADGGALSLPVELIRLAGDVIEAGPLGLLPNVSVTRRIAGTPPDSPPAPAPGPLKILAAVAAPDETATPNAPLDVEREMGAVLAAVSGVVGSAHAQVRILEVASLTAIRAALASDEYHVLHLSAHGSPDAVELEDEDGGPLRVTSGDLMQALKHAGRRVPLIVLSSCSGGAAGSAAMAAGLLGHGAERVLAMLAPVTDRYATLLAASLYRELALHPAVPAGVALARARAETDAAVRSEQAARAGESASQVPVPEYGVATLLASRGDGPLVDPAAAEAGLSAVTTPPTGRGVRELPLGALIGRRAQLRDAMGVLRRTQRSVERHGAASGVVLTGIGGIGKTALAGRVISRLRDEGWLIAVHEGRWSPVTLLAAVAQAIAGAPRSAGSADLSRYLEVLSDPAIDDVPKLAVIVRILRDHRLLLVLDDFEQNLSVGGGSFLESPVDDAITALADAAEAGALLITCRYPLPGEGRFLVPVAIAPLSPAELRRMFLRLPALRDLDADDRRLLVRTIGGHPRLIELTDALMRGGTADFRHVQRKLRDLASRQGVSLAGERPLETALNQAMLFGSADILLDELLTLLTPGQTAIAHQVAVCYGAMTMDDLSFALSGEDQSADPDLAGLQADVNHLTDLTLLTPGPDVEMHPWTSGLITRNAAADTAPLHERALAMRYRRFKQDRAGYDDLIDVPRHLAALGRFGAVADDANDTIQSFLAGTLAVCAYLAEIRSLVPRGEDAWGTIADLEIRALTDAGSLPAATRLAHALLQEYLRRTDADPGNAGWQRDLSVSHEKVGDLAVAAGDLSAARDAYSASLAIRQRLVDADPGNAGWQRDLSVSHEKVGDLAVAAGDLSAARDAYSASLAIRQRLVDADPGNAGWQRDLSVSHSKVGDLAVAVGDFAAARSAYEASLTIRTRLAALDPSNAQWRNDLQWVRQKLDALGG
jgi:tetratricopeptide (TPR) repeat protein